MRALEISQHLTVNDYLAGEPGSACRHEYLGGAVHAMGGASEEHNVISLNLASALRAHLRGKPCRVFMADVKVRLQIANADIFYYPDVMVVCDPQDTERLFKRHPRVLVEVLSPETERTDRREKFLNHTQIASLEEYVLVAQDRLEAIAFRRANPWQPEVLRQAHEALRFVSLEFALPLEAVYEGVSLSAARWLQSEPPSA